MGIFCGEILGLHFCVVVVKSLTEFIGIWVRGCHRPAIVGARLCMASLSDVVSVVLYRYLSLTVMQSGSCLLYNRGNPKATESIL